MKTGINPDSLELGVYLAVIMQTLVRFLIAVSLSDYNLDPPFVHKTGVVTLARITRLYQNTLLLS